jgi:hypothetical protein
MLTEHEINVIQGCISNYISTAQQQKNSLTIGVQQCSTLNDFFDAKIKDCYNVLEKLNHLTDKSRIELKLSDRGFTTAELLKAEQVIKNLLAQ